MTVILLILYAFYFILVGAQGNANEFLQMVQQEKTFLYWALVLLVITALWQVQTAAPLARAFAVLIVVGFLLSNKNGLKIIANARQILPALGGIQTGSAGQG